MIMYDYVWLWMIMDDYGWLFMDDYLCMVMYGYVW